VPPDFALTIEEAELQRNLPEITVGHLAWRRAKIAELGDELLFRQGLGFTTGCANSATGGSWWQ
jgi:hypothetical protein